MSGTVLPVEYAMAFPFGRLQHLFERAERCFRRTRHPVSHTLRLSSTFTLIDHASQGKQTRLVPCAWGVRRDEYRWRGGEGDRDCAELRRGASIMGRLLVYAPLPGWRELLPGSMADLMGKPSDLYLADYWLLALHYLVWTGRLPYPIKARWLRGSNIHDERFEFVSESPVGLAEASLDALILFREAAAERVAATVTLIEPTACDGATRRIAIEPPICRDGQWRVTPTQEALAPLKEPEAQAGSRPLLPAATHDPAALPKPPPSAHPAASDHGLLQLDDQTFTIRFAGAAYRFAARNKQLFALLERINRRPAHRISFEDLRSVGDVWDGLNVEDSTIRGAVARLRKLLRQHEMEPLARRIITGTYQGTPYVLLRTDEETDG